MTAAARQAPESPLAPAERDRLAGEWFDFAVRQARLWTRRRPWAFDDAAGEALLGLAEALAEFDQARGARFPTLLLWKMRKARQADDRSRHPLGYRGLPFRAGAPAIVGIGPGFDVARDRRPYRVGMRRAGT